MSNRILCIGAFLCAAALLLSACQLQPPPAAQEVQPVQSPNDDKNYRLVTLDNGLRALLVSDTTTEKSAASLDVHVGSAQNPRERAGLAHFLEHMLFLGTDKYPHPGEYEEFITEHGGTRNAYTAFEHTNYFFDIDQEYLAGALDRFAQFFISPRFDQDYVSREVNAVEAEYRMGIKTDERRVLDALREVVNPRHPFSILGVGAKQTLADFEQQPVRAALLEWYRRYYSANQMTLVVLGRESVDELEAMVRQSFTAIPDRGLRIDDISEPLYRPGSLPRVVNIRPQASERQLQLSFPLPDYRRHYRRNSMAYLGNLLGHEGQGSLLALLKAEGWAEGLGAGPGLAWRGGAAFSLQIDLTEQGLARREQVLAKVFEYLEMLRNAGPRRDLYEEQGRIAEQQFRFSEPVQALRYVTSLANDMHYYEPADVLRGGFLMSEFDAAEISELLARYLTPDNVMVVVLAEAVPVDRESEFYFTPYSVSAAAADAPWREVDRETLDPRLHLPRPNPYIAVEAALRPRVTESSNVPRLAVDEPGLTLWFHQDDEFRVPRGAMYMSFPRADGKSPRRWALQALYVNLLQDAVTEITYPAMLAGLGAGFYHDSRGIGLTISGYDEKQAVLLKAMVEAVTTAQFDAARFANIKDDLVRQLENFKTLRPFQQVMARTEQLLVHGEWDENALLNVLDDLLLADVREFAGNYWARARAEVLLNGNYDEAVVAEVRAALSPLLGAFSVAPAMETEVVKLPPDTTFLYPLTVAHADSVLLHYFQAPANDWPSRALAALTAQVFTSGFFQQLRTEQQLGYLVNAFYWPLRDVPGIGLLVQSPTASAVDVTAAVDTFLRQSLAGDGLTEEQFLRHRRALKGEILKPHNNLSEQSEYYWREIARRSPEFDSRQQLAAAVSALDFQHWREAARRMILQQPAQVRIVAPGTWGLQPAGEKITGASAFQQAMPGYLTH
ncbi:MAG: insulinase family protein [Halieaceae bacterium]|nr:insulinase family protein [Halieaceae bacterium]